MTAKRAILIILAALCLLFGACQTAPQRPERQQVPDEAGLTRIGRETLSEEQRLTVGILPFTVTPKPALNPQYQQWDAIAGLNPEIAPAERYFFADHLKRTMEQTGYWNGVLVAPLPAESLDLIVTGQLVESNGWDVTVDAQARDASGRIWTNRRYHIMASDGDYAEAKPGVEDPYQDVFDAIANDLVFRFRRLSSRERKEIQYISDMRFARDLAPLAYHGYLSRDAEGRVQLQRYPAQGDPFYQRIVELKGVEYNFLDELDNYIADFYQAMWQPYFDWRQASQNAVRNYIDAREKAIEAENEAMAAAMGGMVIAVAGAYGQSQGVQTNADDLVRALMMASQEASARATYHADQAGTYEDELESVSSNFAEYTKPSLVEIEGRVYELTGTAEQQYQRFREILRQIYEEERSGNFSGA